jgi:hypothetical protein
MKTALRIAVLLLVAGAASAQTWPTGAKAGLGQIDIDGMKAATIPSGMILFVDTGSCPAGWSELAGAGKYVILAASANNDAGTAGGSNSFTPTVASTSLTAAAQAVNSLTAAAQTLSGSTASESTHTHSVTSNVAQNVFTNPAIAWPAAVPAFTGTPFSSVINHTHTVTTTWNVQGGTTASTTGTHVMTSTATGGSARVPTTGDVISETTANPAGGVASITPAGSNAWPAGVPTATGGGVTLTNNAVTSGAGAAHLHGVGTLANAASAVTGTMNSSAVTGTITMNQVDVQPAYLKLIGCKKQ